LTATENAFLNRRDYPKTKYTETLFLIAGIEVLFSWTFLVLVGLLPSRTISSLAPASTAVGFAILGLGILEYGVVVLNVQLAWILPDDHDESGVAPFLCGYCLLAQILLMFPPLIIVAIVVVPLLLISIAVVGWYFQKFTSLRLSTAGQEVFQYPLSMKSLLWMPVWLLGLGLIPPMLFLFCGPNLFELAVTNGRYLGVAVICSAMGMVAVSFLPLLVCYSFLFISQSTRSFQIVSTAVAVLSLGLAMAIEALASNFTSAIMPLVSLAIAMFVAGLWMGLLPWRKDGLQIVFAKPSHGFAVVEVKFDDVQ